MFVEIEFICLFLNEHCISSPCSIMHSIFINFYKQFAILPQSEIRSNGSVFRINQTKKLLCKSWNNYPVLKSLRRRKYNSTLVFFVFPFALLVSWSLRALPQTTTFCRYYKKSQINKIQWLWYKYLRNCQIFLENSTLIHLYKITLQKCLVIKSYFVNSKDRRITFKLNNIVD